MATTPDDTDTRVPMDAQTQVIDLAALQAVPYVDGGRSHEGCDCYGIGWLYNRLRGVALPSYGAITAADTRPFLQAVAEGRVTWREVTLGEQGPGDVVLLRRRLTDLPLHVGWIVDDGRVMSTTRATGVTFQPIEDLSGENRLRGIYRYECDREDPGG